jgi:hypothetical protein
MRLLVLVAALALPAAALAQSPAPVAPAKTKKCILNRNIQITKLSPADGYWVKTTNGWWRNTASGCPWFDNNRIIRTFSVNDSQCEGDLVEVVDRSSRTIVFGNCGIANWEKMAGAPPDSTSGPLGN